MGKWTDFVVAKIGVKPRQADSEVEETSMPKIEKEAVALRVTPDRSVTILLPKGFRKSTLKPNENAALGIAALKVAPVSKEKDRDASPSL